MVELSRVVRFCVSPGDAGSRAEAGRNTFAAWPAMVGIGAFYEIEVRCQGDLDPITGYLVNISEIDKAVRIHIVPIIRQATRDQPGFAPARLLPSFIAVLSGPLRGMVSAISWRLTPYHAVGMERATADRVLLSQLFEFAAAHRLNCRGLSEEENRRIFGKCNNPSGHGHNYRLEVTVSIPMELRDGDREFDNLRLEQVVEERVIRRFDHTNLDADVREFAGQNSSVENIARVCHGLLDRPLADAGARLIRVRVWETEKTSCIYPAGA